MLKNIFTLLMRVLFGIFSVSCFFAIIGIASKEPPITALKHSVLLFITGLFFIRFALYETKTENTKPQKKIISSHSKDVKTHPVSKKGKTKGGYEYLEDLRQDETIQPPRDWLKKTTNNKFFAGNINRSEEITPVYLLINKDLRCFAVLFEDNFLPVKTTVYHTDESNSGYRRFMLERPESQIILCGEFFENFSHQIENGNFEFDEKNNIWFREWSQLTSGEVYNTVVYDHIDCRLEINPEKYSCNFILRTHTDTST